MRIESIEMNNFRPYKSEKINFSTDKEENINLVIGPNDHGKTSLMDAVKWVLYGGGNNTTQYDQMLHDGVKDQENPEMYVRIEFSHEGSNFVLRREMENIDTKNETIRGNEISLTIDGEVYQDNEQRKVDQILPPEIDRFFFFDAEEIEETAEQSGKMEDQIERVLGLFTVDNAREHSKYIQSKLNSKLKDKREEIESKQELDDEISELEEEESETEDKIERLEEEKERLEGQIETIEDKLGDIEETKSLIEDKKELEKEKEKAKDKLERIEKDRKEEWEELFRDLVNPFRETVLDKIKSEIQSLEDKRDSKDKRRFKNEFKKEATENNHCPICENEEELNLDYSNEVEEDEGLREKIKLLRSKRDVLSDFTANDVDPMELESRKHKVRDEINGINSDLEQISEDLDIGEFTEEDIGKFQEQRKNKLERLDDIEDELEGTGREDGLRKELEEIREEIEAKSREYSRKIDDDEVNELEEKIDTAKQLEDSLDDVINRVIEKKREGIEDEADTIFNRLTNTPNADRRFRLVNESGYKYTIERSDGSIPKISEGKKQIMSLSFILGLNHYADREAPLVMDTPIMRLDRQHRENVAGFLSELDDQIILLLTNAEYNQVKGYIRSVGKEMTINKDAEEEHSWLEEEGVEQ